MKNLICLMVGVFLVTKVSSQVIIALLFGEKLNSGQMEFGLMLSPTFCNITNIESETRTAFGLSLYLTFKQNENLYFKVEASPKGVFGAQDIPAYATGNKTIDSIFKEGGSVERKIKALSLPLLVRYRIKGRLFAEAGPQVNLMFKASDVFETKVDDNDLSYTTDIKDQLTKFDVGACAGLDFKLKKDKGMEIGARYYYGFIDIQKTTGAQHHSVWSLNVSIPVGAGKAAKTSGQTSKL